MRKILITIMFATGINACDNAEKPEDFNFELTYVNRLEAFSVAFQGAGKLILKQYWKAEGVSDSSKIMISDISDLERDSLKNLVNDIKVSDFDTLYPDFSPTDGCFLGLSLKESTNNVTVYPECEKMSKEINNLLLFIRSFKGNHKFIAGNTSYHFRSSPRIPETENRLDMTIFLPDSGVKIE